MIDQKDAVRKITTLYVLNDGKLIDSAQLKRAEIKLNVSQEIQKPTKGNVVQESEFVYPPYDLHDLAKIYENSTSNYRAVKAKAEDSAGLGWTIVDKKGNASEVRRQELIDKLESINPIQPLEDILVNAMVDFESTGNGYIEIARDSKTNLISLLNHIPSITMQVSMDMKIYKHQRGNAKTFFKKFGLDGKVDPKTGKFDPSLSDSDAANEIWQMIHYSPRSDYYGIPDVVPAMGAVLGDIWSRDYNLDFFQNGAIPAYAVIVEGADVTDEVKKAIEDFFKHDVKGIGNAHRTIVIPVPGENVKVRFEPLDVQVKDGSFKLYRQDNKEEILSAHGVPPARAFHFKIGALGGDISKESAKIYEETTISRNRKMIQRGMNSIIAGMGYPEFSFKLSRSQNTDYSQLGSFVSSVSASKTLTVNEQREILSPLFENGLDNIEGGDDIWVDIAGVPTPISEVFFNDQPTKSHGSKSTKSAKIIDYEEVDFELAHQYDKEYTNVKAGESVNQLRKQASAVGDLKKDLIGVYDVMLRDAYNELAKQNSPIKRFFGFKAGGVNINPVLKAVQSHEQEMIDVLRKGHEKGIILGAKHGAERVNANLTLEGKAVVELPDPDITISFNLRDPKVEKYISTQSELVGKAITTSLMGQLKRQMEKGIALGETNEQIAERLKETVGFHGVRDSAGRLITKDVRALMIARTEVAEAFNVGTVQSYDQSGLVSTVVVLDGDNFDDACATANGKIWPLSFAEENPIQHPNCTRAFAPNVK